jgi:hypothetical protein
MTINTQNISLEQAAVIGNSLVGFGSGLSPQERDDVRNTYQLAMLVANKLFDKNTQSEQWFAKLVSVLVDTGWLTLATKYGQRADSSQSLKVANVLVDIIKQAVGAAVAGSPVGAALTALAGETLDKLPKTGDAFNLFERNAKTDRGAMVGVASCAKAPQGEVLLAIGVTDVSTTNGGYDVLFIDWKSDEAHQYNASVVLTVNPSLIGQSRERILQMLGKRVEENIQVYADLLKA